jgi:hypothetical protein
MQEVTARIRFTQPCLGSARKQYGKSGVIYAMVRNPAGAVMFMPTWWGSITRYAAQVLSAHHKEVANISWDPGVDGTTRQWKRYLPQKVVSPGARRPFALHEAFLVSDVIGVNCVLPSKLAIAEFWRLLDVAGRYRGISPHNPREYGNFEVVEIRTRRRKVEPAEAEIEEPNQASQT